MQEIRSSHPGQFHRPDKVNENLYVITAVFNPQRYRTRWKLYKYFERYVLDTQEAILVTVECSFGNREQVFTEQMSDRHIVIHVQTNHQLWLKENLWNIGISRLPLGAKYIATIDSDITFARPDWVGETIQQLQSYDIVQMFSSVCNLNPDSQVYSQSNSFMHGWRASNKQFYKTEKMYTAYMEQFGWKGAPGGAWAYRRSALNTLGGLLDFAILGSADTYMALGLFGCAQYSIDKKFNKEYQQWILDWQERAQVLKQNIGVVKGSINHYWHGDFRHRNYNTRNGILINNDYNPRTDIYRDVHGMWQLTPNKPQLRDDIRSYFEVRNEDSIETYKD